MGGDLSTGIVFGGRLSDFYEENPDQPLPLAIELCMTYLQELTLTAEVDLTGLEKRVTTTGFVAGDDNLPTTTPTQSPQKPQHRTVQNLRGEEEKMNNSAASSPSASRINSPHRIPSSSSSSSPARIRSRMMSFRRPEKELRAKLRLMKTAINQRML